MPYFGLFDLISNFFFFFHFSPPKKFFGAILSLVGLSFQPQFAISIFSGLKVSVYFSSSLLFFCKMLVAILLGMHASTYFIFGIFIIILLFFCHDICHAILGKCIYFCFLSVLYRCANMREFKMLKIKCGTQVRGLTYQSGIMEMVGCAAWPLVSLEIGLDKENCVMVSVWHGCQLTHGRSGT